MLRFEIEDEQEESWLANFVEQVKADHGPEEPGEEMADNIRSDAWQRVVDMYMNEDAGQNGGANSASLSEDHPSSHGHSPDVGNDGIDIAYIGPPSGKGPPGGGGGGGGSTEQPVWSYTSGLNPLDPGVEVDNNEFNIQVDFYGDGWTDELYGYFTSAANYLSSVITGDIEFVTLSNGDWIDDIRIDARLTDIDGVNGVLGQTGITAIRSTDVVNPDEAYLPGTAFMEFDVADLDAMLAGGDFGSVILHEMVHALGFGALWDTKGLVDTDDNGTKRPNDDIPVFIGTEAMRALDANNDAGEIYDGIDQVYIETDGGSGTANVHWDEDTFGEMLMTGWLDPTAPDTLSDITIASLEDMGYETTWVGLDDMIA